jgi:hypothetical protein
VLNRDSGSVLESESNYVLYVIEAIKMAVLAVLCPIQAYELRL